MKVYLDYVHNLREKTLNVASVWVTLPQYYDQKTRKPPPWGATNITDVPDAVRIIGPIDSAIATPVFENLHKALTLLGHEVVADEDADQ